MGVERGGVQVRRGLARFGGVLGQGGEGHLIAIDGVAVEGDECLVGVARVRRQVREVGGEGVARTGARNLRVGAARGGLPLEALRGDGHIVGVGDGGAQGRGGLSDKGRGVGQHRGGGDRCGVGGDFDHEVVKVPRIRRAAAVVAQGDAAVGGGHVVEVERTHIVAVAGDAILRAARSGGAGHGHELEAGGVQGVVNHADFQHTHGRVGGGGPEGEAQVVNVVGERRQHQNLGGALQFGGVRTGVAARRPTAIDERRIVGGIHHRSVPTLERLVAVAEVRLEIFRPRGTLRDGYRIARCGEADNLRKERGIRAAQGADLHAVLAVGLQVVDCQDGVGLRVVAVGVAGEVDGVLARVAAPGEGGLVGGQVGDGDVGRRGAGGALHIQYEAGRGVVAGGEPHGDGAGGGDLDVEVLTGVVGQQGPVNTRALVEVEVGFAETEGAREQVGRAGNLETHTVGGRRHHHGVVAVGTVVASAAAVVADDGVAGGQRLAAGDTHDQDAGGGGDRTDPLALRITAVGLHVEIVSRQVGETRDGEGGVVGDHGVGALSQGEAGGVVLDVPGTGPSHLRPRQGDARVGDTRGGEACRIHTCRTQVQDQVVDIIAAVAAVGDSEGDVLACAVVVGQRDGMFHIG